MLVILQNRQEKFRHIIKDGRIILPIRGGNRRVQACHNPFGFNRLGAGYGDNRRRRARPLLIGVKLHISFIAQKGVHTRAQGGLPRFIQRRKRLRRQLPQLGVKLRRVELRRPQPLPRILLHCGADPPELKLAQFLLRRRC